MSGFVRPPIIDLTTMLGKDQGLLALKMGIQWHELTPEYSVATMPVEGNTQTFGILHGGSFVVLGESMGSIAANIYSHLNGLGTAVGIEVSASHTGSGVNGFIIGTCRSLHLGRTLTTHEIVCTNENGKRLSTVRITNLIKKASG
jgi:uncharacterized protein (TIGR00369 family)